MSDNFSKEFQDEVKKQVRVQSAKWVVSAFVGVFIFAVIGWWFYFVPKIKSYIIEVAGTTPADAIVAFDRTPSNPCPDGWTVWREATSRVIVGAGNNDSSYEQKYKFGSNGDPLSPRAYREHGGAETHKLRETEMPRHSHDMRTGEVGHNIGGGPNSIGWGNQTEVETGKRGGNQSFEVMQPYVALYYCKKA